MLLETDILLSPAPVGVTLPVPFGLKRLISVSLLLSDDPETAEPAWLSWALIRLFCSLSCAISASIATEEICELRALRVSANEEVGGRLVRGRLVRLEAELRASKELSGGENYQINSWFTRNVNRNGLKQIFEKTPWLLQEF